MLKVAGSKQVKPELLEKIKELAGVKEKLENAKMQEMSLALAEREDELSSIRQKASSQEAEIESLRRRIKEFENLSDNLEVLEKTRRQAEDLEAENEKLKDLADQGSVLLTTVEELTQQKDALVKELTILKSQTFEQEQKVLKSEDDGREDGKEYRVVEEIKGMLLEAMLLCKTLDTLAREGSSTYADKLDKARECSKYLREYVKTVDRQERLNVAKALHSFLPFLSFIPKKTSHLKIIDDCIINSLKAREVKMVRYENYVAKYNELADISAKRCSEFQFKLSCYNSSNS